jgi:hypothetical protein
MVEKFYMERVLPQIDSTEEFFWERKMLEYRDWRGDRVYWPDSVSYTPTPGFLYTYPRVLIMACCSVLYIHLPTILYREILD